MLWIHLLLLLPAQFHRWHNIFLNSRMLTVSWVNCHSNGLFLRHRAISSREKTFFYWFLPLHEYILVSWSGPHRLQENLDYSLREWPPEPSIFKEPNFYNIWNPYLRNLQLFYHWITIKIGVVKPERRIWSGRKGEITQMTYNNNLFKFIKVY